MMRPLMHTAAIGLMASLVIAQDSPQLTGINYLKGVQAADGSFGAGSKRLIDTSESAVTVATQPGNAAAANQAAAFAQAQTPNGTDGLARKLIALATSSGADVSGTKTALLAEQNIDGSWGAAKGHRGSALDTSLAIRALSHARTLEPAAVARAMLFLDATRTTTGGWPLQEDGATDLYVTANVIYALAEFQLRSGLASEDLEESLIAGSAFIIGAQQPDGSFGTEDKVVNTSWSMMALLRTTQPTALANAATYLTSQQAGNGSWSDSVHLTALAARALFEKTTRPAPPPADLVVQSITIDPASPTGGQPVFVTVATKNQGGRTARGVRVRLSEAGSIGPDATIAELRAGETRDFVVTTVFSPGVHTLAATADPDNVILESSDANNSFTTGPFTVGGAGSIDLSVSGIAFSTSAPQAGVPFTITATATNAGTTTAGIVAVAFFDGNPAAGGVQIGADVMITVPASGSGSASLSASLTSGTHTIFAVVDRPNFIAETSEANNSAFASLTVLPATSALPDLAVTALNVSSAAPRAGDPIMITVFATNVGGTYTGPPAVVRIYDGDPAEGGVPVGADVVAVLPTGSPAQITVSASFTAGTHHLVVRADDTNLVAETSESNNRLDAFITVSEGPLADLRINTLTAAPTSVDGNQPVILTATVENIGTRAATAFVVRFFDGSPVGGRRIGFDFAVATLAPGGTTTVQTVASFPPGSGSHTVFALADATNRVAETNESNNLKQGDAVTVSANAFVDPQVFTEEGTDFWMAAPPIPLGATAFVRITSDTATSATVTIAGVPTVVAVAPGAPASVTIPLTVTFFPQATVPGAGGVQTAKGVHVTSSNRLRAWIAVKTGSGDSEAMIQASLVLPTNSLGTSYVVHSFGGPNLTTGNAGVIVVAVGAGTTDVTVDLAGPTPAVTKTMSAGDAIFLSQLVDISGTTVISTQPVVCYTWTSGSSYPSPGAGGPGASIFEQMLPASMPSIATGFLGKRFFIAPELFKGAGGSFHRARVMAHEDGTVVTIQRNGSADTTLTLAANTFTDVDVRTPTRITLSKPGSVTRGLPVEMAVVPPLAGYAPFYRVPVFKTGTTAILQPATYAALVAPLDGTRTAMSNGLPSSTEVETRSANAYETLADETRFSNEALWAPRQNVSATLGEECLVRPTRPIQLHVFRGNSNNPFAYLAGYRFTTKPDLVPSSILASASEFFTGTPVALSTRILNMGFGDAGPFRVRFFDGNPDQGGLLIADVSVSGLAREEEVVVSTGGTPWIPQVPGQRALTVLVDPLGEVDEADRINNSLARTETVQAVTLLSGQLTLGGTTFLGNQNVNIMTALSNLSTNAALGVLTDGQIEIVIEDSAGNVVATLPLVQVPELAAVPAGMQDWRYYLDASIAPTSLRHGTQLLGGNVNFSSLLATLGQQQTFDLESIRIFEVTGDSFRERPAYLIPAVNFNLASNASGKVEWMIPGPLAPSTTRRFRIYFDSLDVPPKPAVARLHEPMYLHGGGIYWPGIFLSSFTHSFVQGDRRGNFVVSPIPTTGASALDEFLFNARIIQAGLACQDLSGDGFHDALRSNDEDALDALNDPVYLARTSGSNTLVKEHPAILSVFSGFDRKIRTHDLNGDEFADVVVMNRNDTGEPSSTNSPFFVKVMRVQAYLGQRDGTFRLSHEFIAASDPPGSTPTINSFEWDLADVNGDGKIDLILQPHPNNVFTQAPTVRVFFGTGTGTFATTPVTTTFAVGAIGIQQNFTAGDFDSDGKVDLVFLPDSASPLLARFVKGNGDGTFQTPVTISTTALPAATNSQEEKKESFDFDRSGTRDVAYALTASGLRVSFGSGSGTFPTGKDVAIGAANNILAMPKMELASAAIADSARNARFLRDLVFNTNGLNPGNYRVRMNVYGRGNQLLFSTTSGFEVISPLTGGTPADITEARVVTNKATYAAGETATITSTTINASTNATLTDLTVNVSISGPASATPSPATKAIASLAPGATDNLVSTLAIGTLAPGTYTVTMQVLQSGSVIAEDDTTFSIAPTFRFTGTASAVPASVTVGSAFSIDFSLTNLGNVGVTGAPAEFLVIIPATGSVAQTYTTTVTAAPGGTASGSIGASSTGLSPGTYALVFRVTAGGTTHFVSRTFFTVTAPACPYLNFALFGNDEVKLAGQATTNDVGSTNNGDVFSNTEIRVTGSSTLGGDAASAGPAGSITVTGSASITGTQTTGAAAIPLPSIDALVNTIELSNSNGSIGLTANGENPLDYTEFELKKNDSITLAPGFYFFTKFTVKGTLSVGTGGAVIIAVRGDVKIQDSAQVNPGADPAKFLLLVAEPVALDDDDDDEEDEEDEEEDEDEDDDDDEQAPRVDIKSKAKLWGAVVGPAARIKASGDAEVTGALVGQEVRLEGKAKVRYSSAVQSHCATLVAP